MVTIVGLGNKGEEYENTRHNIGWLVLHEFMRAQHFPSAISRSAYAGVISEGTVAGREVRVLFPHTFMNHSGSAVKKVLQDGTAITDLIIVHDEIDLPLGEVRISVGRGAGGHNGIKSIIDTLGSKDFARVRVGIGEKNIFGILKRPHGEALSNFVLGVFKKREEEKLQEVNEKVHRAILEIIQNGVEKAMNICNS